MNKYRRIGIVAVMLAVLLVPWFTVYSEDTTNNWIFFDRDGQTSTQITIVEGRGVNLIHNKPANLYLSRLIIRDAQNDEADPDTVWINEANDTLNASMGARGVYTIVGEYYTPNAMGSAVYTYFYDEEDDTAAIRTQARVQRIQNGANDASIMIKQDSTISIKADSVHNQTPSFSIIGGGRAPTGDFLQFDDGEVVSSRGTETDNEWYYNLQFKKDMTTLNIQIIAPYEITTNSEFDIDFSTAKSDTLIVNIKSADDLLGDIQKALSNPDQREPYMTFADYNDLDYITENFSLIKKAVVYGVEVNFTWEWVDSVSPEENPVVSISNPLFSTHYTAKVTRHEEDVEGTLTANIVYQPSGSVAGVSAEHPLRVIVKGKGTPPNTFIVTDVDDEGEPTDTVAIGTTPVRMDIYDGSVPGHNMQTGSFHPLFLQIKFGMRGGRADYVKVTTSNSNIAYANFDGSTAGSYQDLYAWGASLTNPSSNEAFEGALGLKLFPTEVGATTITIQYYASTDVAEILIHEIKFVAQVVDSSPNKDSLLKSLELFEIDENGDSEATTGFVFNPDTREYALQVGNWVNSMRFRATKNDTKAKSDIGVSCDGVAIPDPMRSGVTSPEYEIVVPDDPDKMTFLFELTVTAEDLTTTTYNIYVERLPPSNDTALTDLTVYDNKGNVLPYFRIGNQQNSTFDVNVRDYGMEPAYNIKMITIDAQTSHIKSVVTIDPEPQETGSWIDRNEYITFADDLETQLVTITVTAEDGSTSDYRLMVARQPPENDALLDSLVIQDHTTQTVDFLFDQYVEAYDTVPVSNTVKFVTVYPTPRSAYATVQINGEDVTAQSGLRINLDVEITVPIVVTVTAEDGKTVSSYSLSVRRLAPSTDATLSGLKAGSLTLAPLFSSPQTSYACTADEKTTAVSVTPTATDKNATIKVNGMPVRSGAASTSIQLAEVSTVKVEVTAEDKTTKRTYTITITNDSLRIRSTNADLESLEVNDGDMSPIFKSSISTYTLPVDATVDYIDIFPEPVDARATVDVKLGSKYIGDYEGNYSEALKNGNNKFSIEVTADDGVTKKTYTLTVNRSKSGQSGGLNPIDTSQIDFKKSSTIYVDITKYTVISSKIFTELEKHPDTVIIFQGNDYSLTFKGSDISTIIPFAETYNLSMSFTSPDEDKIYDMLSNHDTALPIVFLYFKHHGVLPAPATLRVDLGKRYRSRTLYLHYYNPEMDRIEYYGKVTTNSRGSVAFRVDHFSDYLLTTRRLSGSVDKTSEVNIGVSDADKVNPDTGR
ncbi:MAG: cadherin-like beta sandwich domain-containing protein [Acetanaerobacterium sp.]